MPAELSTETFRVIENSLSVDFLLLFLPHRALATPAKTLHRKDHK
jgi:hypothetical protein